MSYILDALKKVERERARARHSLVEVAWTPPPSRRRLWPWAVAGVLLLNAAVASLVLLRSPFGPGDVVRDPDRTAAITGGAVVTSAPEVPAAPAERAVTPGRSAPPERAVPRERAAPPEGAPRDPVQPSPPPRRVERQTVPRAEPPRVGTPTLRPRSSPVQADATIPVEAPEEPSAEDGTPDAAPPATAPIATPGSPAASAAPPAPPPPAVSTTRPPEGARTRSASDLPPAFQTVVSGLKLEVLLYGATAADRMVFMNGRKYVEGQRVAGDVVVERITADGVVLAHDRRQFLLTPSR